MEEGFWFPVSGFSFDKEASQTRLSGSATEASRGLPFRAKYRGTGRLVRAARPDPSLRK
jgi:hypothetical protein